MDKMETSEFFSTALKHISIQNWCQRRRTLDSSGAMYCTSSSTISASSISGANQIPSPAYVLQLTYILQFAS